MKTKLLKICLKLTKSVIKNRTNNTISNALIRDGQFVTTDGHRLFQVPVNAEDGCYSHEDLMLVAKQAGRKKDLDLELPALSNPPSYPPIEQLFSADIKSESHTQVLVNARHLRDLCDAAIPGDKEALILLFVDNKYKELKTPLVAHFFADEKGTVARAIQMPIKMGLMSKMRSLLTFTGRVKGFQSLRSWSVIHSREGRVLRQHKPPAQE